jgi:hypothetical protein
MVPSRSPFGLTMHSVLCGVGPSFEDVTQH